LFAIAAAPFEQLSDTVLCVALTAEDGDINDETKLAENKFRRRTKAIKYVPGN
jgi:hypothetical protein